MPMGLGDNIESLKYARGHLQANIHSREEQLSNSSIVLWLDFFLTLSGTLALARGLLNWPCLNFTNLTSHTILRVHQHINIRSYKKNLGSLKYKCSFRSISFVLALLIIERTMSFSSLFLLLT